MLATGIVGCETLKSPTPFFSEYKSEHTPPEKPKPIEWPKASILACNVIEGSKVCVINPGESKEWPEKYGDPEKWSEQYVAFNDPKKLQTAKINADRAQDLSSEQSKRIKALIGENQHLVNMGELTERRERLYVKEVKLLERRMLIDKITFGFFTILGIVQ